MNLSILPKELVINHIIPYTYNNSGIIGSLICNRRFISVVFWVLFPAAAAVCCCRGSLCCCCCLLLAAAACLVDVPTVPTFLSI